MLSIIVPLAAIAALAALYLWLRLYVDPRAVHRRAIRARIRWLNDQERARRVHDWS